MDLNIKQVFIVLIAMFGFSGVAVAETGEWRIASMNGAVRVLAPGKALMPGSVNQDIPNGTTITTGPGASVKLDNGQQTIVIAPNSRMTVAADSTPEMTRILQTAGSALFEVNKRPNQHFRVESPLLAAVVKGTGFTVSAGLQEDVVHVSHGLVEVSTTAGGTTRDIPAGETARVTREAPTVLASIAPIAQLIEVQKLVVPAIDYAAVTDNLVSNSGPSLVSAPTGAPQTTTSIDTPRADTTRGAANDAQANVALRLASLVTSAASDPTPNPDSNAGSDVGGGKGGADSNAGNGAGNGSTAGGNSNAGGNGNGNGNAPGGDSNTGRNEIGGGNSNASGNGNGNDNPGSGNSNAGGNGNGSQNSGSGNSSAGGNGNSGNGNSGNGNSGSGNSNAGGNGNAGDNSGSDHSNAGGNGNSGSESSNSGGSGNSGSGNSNAGGDGNAGAGGSAGSGNTGNSAGSGNSNAGANGNAGSGNQNGSTNDQPAGIGSGRGNAALDISVTTGGNPLEWANAGIGIGVGGGAIDLGNGNGAGMMDANLQVLVTRGGMGPLDPAGLDLNIRGK